MWTPATREKYSCHTLRYQSDVTDQEWLVIEPLFPKPKTRGRRWRWPLREIVNAIFYVMRSGCTWRLLPADFPPWSTVYRWFPTASRRGWIDDPPPCHPDPAGRGGADRPGRLRSIRPDRVRHGGMRGARWRSTDLKS
ncbi:transposase [Nitrobacter sp. NHB1]|uniref:transposase n=1 Tax=Nitrobacter sp. NHB1 TaxID=3119830 RepID=UPI003000E71D